jgi:hypothetical protein
VQNISAVMYFYFSLASCGLQQEYSYRQIVRAHGNFSAGQIKVVQKSRDTTAERVFI